MRYKRALTVCEDSLCRPQVASTMIRGWSPICHSVPVYRRFEPYLYLYEDRECIDLSYPLTYYSHAIRQEF